MKEIFIRENTHFNLRNSDRQRVLYVVTLTYGLESISFRGSQIGTTLPNDIKQLPRVASFKTNINHWGWLKLHLQGGT